MESSRLPRFKRSRTLAPIQLTGRDQNIIRLIHRHRFLRSSHVISLLGSSRQQVLRRLQLLFHHGFLERPRAQLDYYRAGGSREIVYGLGNKGGAVLERELGTSIHPLAWNEKNHSIGRVFLEHTLLVSDLMVAIELACRKSGIRFLTEDEIRSDEAPDPKSIRWRVNISHHVRLGVVPDRVFALEVPDQDGNPRRAFFFLEADRGTMPVSRRHLYQTSFFRKLLAYQATWSQGIHRTQLGFNRFRVLTVTTSVARIESLIVACSQLKGGHGLFLFADRNILASDILSAVWHSGRQGQTATLLD